MKNSHSLKTIILAGSLLLQLSALCFHSQAAPGDVDISFDPGLGVNGTVKAVAIQADGKVIIGGQFTTVKGLARTNLARLNADGSGDATFNPGMAYRSVSALTLQPDGKLLVGSQYIHTECDDEWGCFDYYYSAVTRLHANGNLDDSFALALGADSTGYSSGPFGVNSIVVQSDGKVLVGGGFNAMNGTNRNGIVRLNADGSLDGSFNPGAGVGGYQVWVSSVMVQTDGKVLIGGNFTTFDGTNRNGFARLNANGSLDTGFDGGAALGGESPKVESIVESIVMQSDGKLLVGGVFTSANGSSITRFNADGTLDSSFNSGTGANGFVSAIAVQSDGRVLVGGFFTVVNGTNRNRIARLNADGSLDSSFNPGTGMNAVVWSVVVQSDGRVVVAGAFTGVNGTERRRVARLNADGTLDSSFHPGTGIETAVASLALQPDGKVLIGHGLPTTGGYSLPSGSYTFINGTNRYGSTRLNGDGTLDGTFISSTNFRPDLMVYMQPEDCFDDPRYGCEQIASVVAILVQPDGKVLIGGAVYTTITGDEVWLQSSRLFLDRFNADGSRDTSFEMLIGDPGDNYYGSIIRALALQSDGKIIVGGDFSSIKGTNRNGIARLHANGTLDNSFNPDLINPRYNPGTGLYDYGAISIAVQSNGQILVGGSGVARLNSDGTRDFCYNPIFNNYVYSLVLQPDNKLLVGGLFLTVNGVSRNRIARLNDNGSLDNGFNPGKGVNGTVRAIALQPDGNVLIGGDFLNVNGITRHYVARLIGGASSSGSPTGPALRLFSTNNAVVAAWPSASAGFTLQQNSSLATADWVNVTNASATVGAENQVAIPAPSAQRFFRLLSTAGDVPPPVAPQLTADSQEAGIALSWTAFPGATGHHLQRATNSSGPYTAIAHPSTTNYTDTTVEVGTAYYYIVSVIYPCGESATSHPVGRLPLGGPAVFVQSITMSFVAQGSRYHTRAVVRIVDNTGAPYGGVSVTGDFTGSINNPGRTGVTDANGAVITSSSTIKNGTVTFTVTAVAGNGITYKPSANVVTSASISR